MTYEDLIAANRRTILQGVLEGKPLSDSVKSIIQAGVKYGAAEAKRAKHFFASIRVDTDAELGLAITETLVNAIFEGSVAKACEMATQMSAAYGFQRAKHRDKFRKIEQALDRLKKEKSCENSERFFAECNALLEGGATVGDIEPYVQNMEAKLPVGWAHGKEFGRLRDRIMDRTVSLTN